VGSVGVHVNGMMREARTTQSVQVPTWQKPGTMKLRGGSVVAKASCEVPLTNLSWAREATWRAGSTERLASLVKTKSVEPSLSLTGEGSIEGGYLVKATLDPSGVMAPARPDGLYRGNSRAPPGPREKPPGER